VLLVARRDRLARDVVVAAMVERLAERHGARVLALMEAATAPDLSRADAPDRRCFSAYERQIIKGRIRAAMKVKRERNEFVGEAPIGFQLAPDGYTLATHQGEQTALERIREHRAAGLPLRAIVERLNAEGFPPGVSGGT